MWIQVKVMGMGVSGQIQDILKVTPTIPTDGQHIVYKGKKVKDYKTY